MNMNILKLLAPLALLAGCAKTTTPEYSWTTDPDAVRIEASVLQTKTSPDGSGGFDPSQFLSYDEIAVYDGSKTVTYWFDGDVWAPKPDTDYLVWKAPVTYKAWYPASSKDGFDLPTDQRRSSGSAAAAGNFAKADFMIGEYVCDSKGKIPSDHKLKLVMQRKMALVTVNVDKDRLKNQFEGKDIYMIRVESIQSGLSHVSSDGTGSGSPVEVLPGPYDGAYENGKGDYHAIVVPCGGDASAQFLKITVSWKDDAHPYGEDTPFIVTGRPTFEAGKRYTYKLTVGKDKVEAGDITVSGWGATVDLNDDADKLSDPISMTDLRTQLKAWNDANPNSPKQLKDLITTDLLDANCKKGKLIITGEFDNTTPAYEDTGSKKCYGMSVETLETFEKIAEYARTEANNVKELDLSGLKGLTAIGDIPKKNGSTPYDLSFYAGKFEKFIGSPDIIALEGETFGNNNNLTSVSGLENVTSAWGAFNGCRSLSEVPDMPKATVLRRTFSGTAIKELKHDKVELLAIGDCSALEVIDCPKVNYLIGEAFKSLTTPMNSLKELRLTSEYFEYVLVSAFYGVNINQVTLYLNANQESNIEHVESNNYYVWRPKKADGKTPAVQADGTTDYVLLNDFKAIYCGETPIKE